MPIRKQAAFTLVECLTVIAVLIVITLGGVPTFTGAIHSWKLTTAANETLAAWQIGRIESIKSNRTVTESRGSSHASDNSGLRTEADAGLPTYRPSVRCRISRRTNERPRFRRGSRSHSAGRCLEGSGRKASKADSRGGVPVLCRLLRGGNCASPRNSAAYRSARLESSAQMA